MSKQPTHQILQTKNVDSFKRYMLPGSLINRVVNNYGGALPITSASLAITSASFSANSSSLDTTEMNALVDVRLNSGLYKKYQLNYALSTGSTFNEAVMWADNNS
jgi:hypothetical protein